MANILGYGYVAVKDDGELSPLRELYLKNGATWATVQLAYVKNGSDWIRVFPTPNAIVDLNTSSLTFETYTTFESKTETVTITNNGDEVLTINSAVSSSSDKFDIITDYSNLGSSLPYTVNPGATKSFTVQILGKSIGSDTGSIVLQSNKGVLGSETITISLSCETIPLFSKALVDVSGLSLRHDQNDTTTVSTIRVYNNGNGPLTISGFSGVSGRITVANDAQGISSALFLTIEPGTYRSYRISVAESFKTTYGSFSDTLRIVSDSIDGTIDIPVNILIVPHGTITFTSDGTWEVPIGLINDVELEVQGANGGNGGNDSAAGGAGGSGGFYKILATIPYPQVLQVAIGGRGSVGGTTPGTGGSPGGARGTNSFGIGNGGTGGRAGLSGWSGGGGGGGAATIVGIKNNLLSPPSTYIFGAGGGGGGGGGNRSLGLAANSNFPPVGTPTKALNIDDVGTLSFSLQTQVVEYNAFPTITQPPAATGSTKVIAFGYGFNASGTFTRTVQTNNYVNLTTSTVLTFFARRDKLQTPDSGEDLHLEYSTNGSTWTNITSVSRTVTANTWVTASAQVPAGAKVANGVLLRFRQSVTGSSNFTNKDLWAISSVWNGSATLQFSGLNGETKSGDGGAGGGGGGGYPGGQGGPVRGGDSGANGGYRGSNGVDGSLIYTAIEDKTRAGAPYVKITW
jgi:hypothetical protein